MENIEVTGIVEVVEDEITFSLSDGSEETINWDINKYNDVVIDVEALAGMGVSSEDDNSRSMIENAIADWLVEWLMDEEEGGEDFDDDDDED